MTFKKHIALAGVLILALLAVSPEASFAETEDRIVCLDEMMIADKGHSLAAEQEPTVKVFESNRMSGSLVAYLQAAMHAALGEPIEADGWAGPEFKALTLRMQREFADEYRLVFGHPMTVDGAAGPQVYNLISYLFTLEWTERTDAFVTFELNDAEFTFDFAKDAWIVPGYDGAAPNRCGRQGDPLAEHVQRLYNGFTGRSGTNAEVARWVHSTLENPGTCNQSIMDLEYAFSVADESLRHLGRLDPASIVAQVAYGALLSRTADPGGAQFWTDYLTSSGTNVSDLVTAVRQSTEGMSMTDELCGPSSSSPEAQPIAPVNCDLVSGPVPPEDTTVVFDIRVHRCLAPSVGALIEAAAADGLNLTGWGYRSNAKQIELRKKHCADVWTTPSRNCNPPTAKPGRSMHERGLAIDFANVSSRSSDKFKWLAKNAPTYGLYNLPSEPWHWSTNAR